MADSGELGCGSLSISPAELRAALALEDGRQPPLGSDRAAPLGGQGAGAGSCGGAALLDGFRQRSFKCWVLSGCRSCRMLIVAAQIESSMSCKFQVEKTAVPCHWS